MKRCLMLSLVVLLFVLLTSPVWAGEKYSLKSQDTPKFSFNLSLIQTCSGLILVYLPRTPEPIKLNSDIPRKLCHVVTFYQNGWLVTNCVAGAGSVNCPCDEWGTQTPN